MIRKILYRFVINVRIIIHTCEEISVHRANTITCFHLSRLVCQFFFCIFHTNIATQTLIYITEIVPLVEFSPEEDIPEQEVERLLMAPPKSNANTFDPFVDTMVNEEVSDMLPFTLDRDGLRALDPTTILIAKQSLPLKTKYYRNLMPEWQISMCPECRQVSH